MDFTREDYIGFIYKGVPYRNLAHFASQFDFWNRSYCFNDKAEDETNSYITNFIDDEGIVNIDKFADFVKDAKYIISLDIFVRSGQGGWHSTKLDDKVANNLSRSGNTLEVEGDILYAAKSIDQIIKEGNLDVTEEEILNKLPEESNIVEFAIKSAINGDNY